MNFEYKWKIVLLGDFAVGKTSLIRRYVYDEFSDSYLTTIGVKVTRKDIIINNSVKADLLLWDIAGSDKFIKISPDYLKGASGGIIVGDLTRKSTIDSITEHVELLRSVNNDALISIALNKSDLVSNTNEYIAMTRDKLENSSNVIVLATSAKDGSNINTLFHDLSFSILKSVMK